MDGNDARCYYSGLLDLCQLHMSSQNTSEKRGGIGPGIKTLIVPNEFEAAKCYRVSGSVVEVEVVEHLFNGRIALIYKQIEAPFFYRECTAQRSAFHIAFYRCIMLGIGDEVVDAIDGDGQVHI